MAYLHPSVVTNIFYFGSKCVSTGAWTIASLSSRKALLAVSNQFLEQLSDWLYQILGEFWVAVTQAQKDGENFPAISFEIDPSMEYPPQRPIYDRAGIEPGTSTTGILAEVFWDPPH